MCKGLPPRTPAKKCRRRSLVRSPFTPEDKRNFKRAKSLVVRRTNKTIDKQFQARYTWRQMKAYLKYRGISRNVLRNQDLKGSLKNLVLSVLDIRRGELISQKQMTPKKQSAY